MKNEINKLKLYNDKLQLENNMLKSKQEIVNCEIKNKSDGKQNKLLKIKNNKNMSELKKLNYDKLELLKEISN